MSEYVKQMQQIARERKTEQRIRSMDAAEIVDEIHALEDRLEAAEAKLLERDDG